MRLYKERDVLTSCIGPRSCVQSFQGNTSVVADLFGWGEKTVSPTLTGNDESVKTPGLFLLGSQVRHQAKNDLWIFCFIYKYVTAFSWLSYILHYYLLPTCLLVFQHRGWRLLMIAITVLGCHHAYENRSGQCCHAMLTPIRRCH